MVSVSQPLQDVWRDEFSPSVLLLVIFYVLSPISRLYIEAPEATELASPTSEMPEPICADMEVDAHTEETGRSFLILKSRRKDCISFGVFNFFWCELLHHRSASLFSTVKDEKPETADLDDWEAMASDEEKGMLVSYAFQSSCCCGDHYLHVEWRISCTPIPAKTSPWLSVGLGMCVLREYPERI